ncbi:MAG: AAA family ATPase, partial [Oscillospiraceae bacterium]|nr:AAA family ATPase [Oscillospiraceae bacterium]
MSKKTIPLGVEDFAMIRSRDSYYVDKTELIYELFHDTDKAVTQFTRPRRFGKTLTMSMLDTFFNIQRSDGEKLFEGLDISKHSEFCREYMNQYPVIFLSLKDTDGLNFKSAFEMLRSAIADFCKRLVISDKFEPVDPDDKKIFAKLKAEEGTVS